MIEIKHRTTGAVLFTHCGDSLRDACLIGAYLRGAYLTSSYLTGADLRGANLRGASLSGCYLTGANLTGADLTGADLRGANLRGCYLTGCYLTGADLTGAKWTADIVINKAPIQLYGLSYPVTILDEHMKIGCELHRFDEWDGFDDRQILEMDGKDALRFWQEQKQALMAMCASRKEQK